MKRHWYAQAAVTAVLCAHLLGCGGSAPCPVADDMVDASRSNAAKATAAADEAVKSQKDLESQIDSKKKRIRELEGRKQQVEAELAELIG